MGHRLHASCMVFSVVDVSCTAVRLPKLKVSLVQVVRSSPWVHSSSLCRDESRVWYGPSPKSLLSIPPPTPPPPALRATQGWACRAALRFLQLYTLAIQTAQAACTASAGAITPQLHTGKARTTTTTAQLGSQCVNHALQRLLLPSP